MSAIPATDYLLKSKENIKLTTQPATAEEVEKLRSIYVRAQETGIDNIDKLCREQIQDETSLHRFIYLSACQKGRTTAKLLSQFTINDQNVLIFLANTCIESDGTAGKYLGSLGISDESALTELSRKSFVNMAISLLHENHKKITSAITSSFILSRCRIDLNFVERFFPAFLPGKMGYEEPLNHLGTFVESNFKPSLGLDKVFKQKEIKIKSYKNPELSRKLTYWLGVAILILRQSDDDTIAACIDKKIIDACFELRAPRLRIALTKDLSQFLCLPATAIHRMSAEASIPVLIKMECSLLENMGIDPGVLSLFQKQIPNGVKKDDRKLNRLIELLRHLKDSSLTDLKVKEEVIKTFTSPQRIGEAAYLKRIANFSTIFLFQEERILTPYNLDDEVLIKSLYVEKLKIPNDKQMLEKFHQQLIDHPRLKNTFGVFAGKISGLPEKKPFEEILRFIEVVLHDQFENERANIDHNPHMQHIKEHYPEIFGKWMEICHLKFPIEDETGMIVDFATHYIDFLSLSLDVLSSCLVLDGNPERTKAVMEGVLNPRNQFIKIGYPGMPMSARVKLSLWISDEGLVCLIGEPYDNGKGVDVHSRLEKRAIEVCHQLGIPLVTRGLQQYPWTKVKPYTHALRSLGCEYAYEYVTEAPDRIPFGKYTINEDLWVVSSGS